MWISPSCGLSAFVISLKIVLLPAPFWPMIVNFAFSRTEKLASSRMGLVTS
jgi:hypothetical protein